MRLDPLRTLTAIADHGSFSAAAAHINLSHSAVSVQMRQLEDEAGVALFDRTTRPPKLTDLGQAYVDKARGILAQVAALKELKGGDSLTGRVTFGFVPTTLQTVLPMLLGELRARFPDLQVSARSGLSNDLAAAVENREMSFAFLTAPRTCPRDMVLDAIASEPLFVIAEKGRLQGQSADALLATAPYIAFSRRSWLGERIEAEFARRALPFAPVIELDSIDAVENLVAQGFGVSVVPQRLFAPALGDRVDCLPFAAPGLARHLVMASHRLHNRATLRNHVVVFLAHAARGGI